MKKIINNNLFMLKCVYKAGPIAFACVFSFIIGDFICYYVATKQGVWVIDSIGKDSPAKIVIFISSVFIGILLIESFLNWLSMYTVPIAVTKVGEYLTKELIDKIFDIRQREVENPEFYDKYSRAISEIDQRPAAIITQLQNMLSSSLELILIVTISTTLNWRFTLIFVTAALLESVVSVLTNEVEYKKYEERTNINRKLSYVNRVIYQPEYGELLRNNGGYKGILSNYYSKNIKGVCNLVKSKW